MTSPTFDPFRAPSQVLQKHLSGRHNQKTHGRGSPSRVAYRSAYAEARKGGAGVGDARAAGRAAAGGAREGEKERAAAGRVERLQTQALRARQAAHSGQVTEAQKAKLIERADRLEARARGERVGPVDPKRGTVGAESRAYGTDPNQSYTLRHRLVDMDEIQASNTANGGINPSYDPRLQPRDRSRAASQAQIDTVARTLNPDVLTTDFHRIDAGSPIIDERGNVLSGNGRTLALQRAADLHPEVYAAYREKVKAEAAALGMDPAAVDRMKRPVLVRELAGDGVDPVHFAREANTSGTLRMSPLEQAKVDSSVISDRSLLNLHVKEGQDIDRALRDPANKSFVHDFMKDVPDNERATLLTRNGDLNQMGLYRIKAAVYTRAFSGEAGERMAESMLESLDPDVKTVQNGISAALPAISRTKALIGAGHRDRDLDLTEDFAKTVDVMARVRDNPAFTANTPAHKVIDKYLSQSSMFDRELTPSQERLLRHVDSISRKPTAVRDFLNRWAEVVESQPPPGQESMFGGGRMTKDELIDYLIGGGSAVGATQGGLF